METRKTTRSRSMRHGRKLGFTRNKGTPRLLARRSGKHAECAGNADFHRIPPENRGRLLEMGLLVGTPVELIRFAPMGDPVEIKVRGYNLSLRKHEAEQIWVQPK